MTQSLARCGTTAELGSVEILDLGPSTADFRHDALAGLSRSSGKRISPKYFYDQEGSELFEQITSVDEYYLGRAETSILTEFGSEIAEQCGPGAVVIEYGTGVAWKTRLLLQSLRQPCAYVPIDISCDTLRDASVSLMEDFPALTVLPVCADYSAALRLPALPASHGRMVGFFPGSTIGNFEPDEAIAFLRRVAALVGVGGGLILGTDLKKDARILEAAYDDGQGVTAAFNKNLLARMNRELGADFDLAAFRHVAMYNADAGRIEMYLESLRDQIVTVAGTPIHFEATERLHTENSYKFSLNEVREVARSAGLNMRYTWTDAQGNFAVHFLDAVELT